jgi:energy-coupling factor transporter ATP-binding protein EcfA2
MSTILVKRIFGAKKFRSASSQKTELVIMYVIGKTGMGKSTLLENMAIQDIKNGEGLAFIDPHGRSAELLLDYIPPERHKDVIYFAPFDLDNPIAFNIMEDVGADQRHLVANGLMATFKKSGLINGRLGWSIF